MERRLTKLCALVALLMVVVLPSCRSARLTRSSAAFELSAVRDLIPEGLAFDPTQQRFFISSVFNQKIVQTSAAGAISHFAAPDPAGAILGLEVDRRRGLLWACSHRRDGADSLVAFDLHSGAQLRRIDPPGPASGHLLNDLEIAPDGTIYVTDTATGEVHELAAGSLRLAPLAAGFRSPNGLALTPDARALFVADDEGIAVIDLHTRVSTRMQTSPGLDVRGIDGLYRAGDRLIGVQNASPSLKPRVIAIDVQERPWRAVGVTVLEDRPEVLGIPTTGAVVGDDFYFIARSGLDMLDNEGRIADAHALRPATIRRVRIRSGR